MKKRHGCCGHCSASRLLTPERRPQSFVTCDGRPSRPLSFSAATLTARSHPMFVKSKRGWEIPESLATPEHVFFNRRKFLTVGAAIGASVVLPACEEKQEAQAQATA